ncbi:MAG: hypothetical protein WCI22_05245, partial [Actinomycetota bacterium]
MSRGSSLRKWPGWVLLVFVVAGFLAYGATRDVGAHTAEERVQEITKRLACPVCDGKRLKPEVLAVTVAGASIADVCELSLVNA